MLWYFAYGSNLNLRRLKERIGEWRERKRALLEGYRLSFREGVADIEEDKKGKVYGALYLISEEQLKKLDDYEGKKYTKIKVKAKTEDGEVLALTYYMKEKKKFRRPNPLYLNIVLEGLMEQGYSDEVINQVKRIAEGLE